VDRTITGGRRIKGEVTVPGDKSISHRAVMFGAIAEGLTEISGFLEGADCLSTIDCFRKLGIEIERNGDTVKVYGKGLKGLSKPMEILNAGNSGTTTRLISGILAGQEFDTVLDGDDSLRSRPMKRIITPLTMMGANIKGKNGNDCVPLEIKGGKLKGIDYVSPVASAQVKSCVILAGLYAEGKTTVTEPAVSRNHTELMLKGFGADVESNGLTVIVTPGKELRGQKICVPGDISSAAYFIAAGLIVKDSEILIKNVGINPTRDGVLRVALEMGGNIEVLNERYESGEKVADLLVRSSELHGISIDGEIIPTLIDEIPVIAVMAACASGKTVISDAAELKVKESNRIDTVTEGLLRMGCDVTPKEDGMEIIGGKLKGAEIESYLDHRIAMSFAIAALAAEGETVIKNADCVDISYPLFYETIDKM